MKKIWTLLIIGLLFFSLAGCEFIPQDTDHSDENDYEVQLPSKGSVGDTIENPVPFADVKIMLSDYLERLLPLYNAISNPELFIRDALTPNLEYTKEEYLLETKEYGKLAPKYSFYSDPYSLLDQQVQLFIECADSITEFSGNEYYETTHIDEDLVSSNVEIKYRMVENGVVLYMYYVTNLDPLIIIGGISIYFYSISDVLYADVEYQLNNELNSTITEHTFYIHLSEDGEVYVLNTYQNGNVPDYYTYNFNQFDMNSKYIMSYHQNDISSRFYTVYIPEKRIYLDVAFLLDTRAIYNRQKISIYKDDIRMVTYDVLFNESNLNFNIVGLSGWTDIKITKPTEYTYGLELYNNSELIQIDDSYSFQNWDKYDLSIVTTVNRLADLETLFDGGDTSLELIGVSIQEIIDAAEYCDMTYLEELEQKKKNYLLKNDLYSKLKEGYIQGIRDSLID